MSYYIPPPTRRPDPPPAPPPRQVSGSPPQWRHFGRSVPMPRRSPAWIQCFGCMGLAVGIIGALVLLDAVVRLIIAEWLL